MSHVRLFAAVLTLAASVSIAHADTILVGTDLSNPSSGPVLCPQAADCLVRVSQFTVLTPMLVDDIKVAISGPTPFPSTDGTFSVNLSSALASGPVADNIGSGDLVFPPGQTPVLSQIFDFSGLDILLDPGTYYLQVAGANIMWDSASPLTTTAGTLGQQLSCDPFITCGADISRYDNFPGTYAMQIDGTAITPEPSTFALLATGLLAITALSQRKPLRP
jgi:PEP-CTERM motif